MTLSIIARLRMAMTLASVAVILGSAVADGVLAADGGVVCSVPTDRLPSGLESVEVRPLNCWGGKGRPLVKRF